MSRLTDNPADDWEPAWSPDGEQIALTSGRDGNWEIHVMTADGGDVRNLTNNPADDFTAAWSPDGEQIAFVSRRDGNHEIYVMNADGSEQRNLSDNPSNDAIPSWSPDGEQIAFASRRDGNFEIYVMNVDGGDVRRLTNNLAVDSQPVWSPVPVSGQPLESVDVPLPAGGRLVYDAWDPGCPSGPEPLDTRNYTELGGGHVVPGSFYARSYEIDASTEEVLDFYRMHVKVEQVAMVEGKVTGLAWRENEFVLSVLVLSDLSETGGITFFSILRGCSD